MKRTDLFFAGLLVPLDYVGLLFAGWLAYSLRFHQVAAVLPTTYPLDFGAYFKLVAIVAIGWVGVLALAGVYAIRQRRLSSELGRIFLGASTSVLLVIVLIFFRREFFTSRFIILASWVLAVVIVWLMHAVVRGIQHALLVRGIGTREILVFGQDQTTTDLMSTFHAHPRLGFHVRQVFPEVNLESLQALDTLLEQGVVDEVWLADPSVPKIQGVQLVDRCSEHAVVFKFAADVFDTQAARVDMQDIAGIPVIEVKRTPLDGWGRILKRTFDVAGATIGLIIFFLPGLVVAAIIKLDSAGPVFARLERVGQGQKKFTLWKFRSMVRDAQVLKPQLAQQNERADGPLFKMKHDPRITRVGRWLRKTSIDELPQLMNVWQGQMSLVGPRPHEPAEVARYEKGHKKLLAIKPGITGMAQVSGRSNLNFEEEVRLDTFYIEHWSLWLDIQIISRTPWAVVHMETVA
ncbi:MAG: sugar transferase [Candidatus Kerfeldbacteria bacterium]|nr:sugar transferase [Candidatus Kerfeldbacteria bacterium]